MILALSFLTLLSRLSRQIRKLATYVITGATLWQLVFYEEYHIPGYEGKHVFTDIQKAYRGWVDQKIWGRQALPPPQPPSEAENKRGNHDSK